MIFKRKSIRSFTDEKVSTDKIKNLIRAGMQAPSAFNSQPWEFIVVSDKKDLKAVSKMSRYARPAENAQKLIIVLGNTERDNVVMPMIQQDLSACTQNILLQAVAEGLGAVWLGFYPIEDRVNALRDYFNIPDHVIPFSVIAIGYPKEDKEPESRYDESKIHFMHRNLNNFLKIFKYSSIFNNNVIILFDIESKFLLIKRTINIYCKNNLEFFYF